ncbi:hypothetical protein Hanom_Chr07g00674791 [Helianthus anomalus]
MLPCVVLLCMTCHLCWRFGHHKVARNVSPISFAVNLQTHQETPTIHQLQVMLTLFVIEFETILINDIFIERDCNPIIMKVNNI